MTERTYVLCEDCHRVLWAEDGPVCPECLEIRAGETERHLDEPEGDCES